MSVWLFTCIKGQTFFQPKGRVVSPLWWTRSKTSAYQPLRPSPLKPTSSEAPGRTRNWPLTRHAPPRPLGPPRAARVPTCTCTASSSARPTGWPRCAPSTGHSAHTQRRQRRQKSSATRSPCSGQRQPLASSRSAGPGPPGVPLCTPAPAIQPSGPGGRRAREGLPRRSESWAVGRGGLRAGPAPTGRSDGLAAMRFGGVRPRPTCPCSGRGAEGSGRPSGAHEAAAQMGFAADGLT